MNVELLVMEKAVPPDVIPMAEFYWLLQDLTSLPISVVIERWKLGVAAAAALTAAVAADYCNIH